MPGNSRNVYDSKYQWGSIDHTTMTLDEKVDFLMKISGVLLNEIGKLDDCHEKLTELIHSVEEIKQLILTLNPPLINFI